MKANKTQWSIDPSHSEIAFKVRHLMIAYVKGSFKTFDADIYTIDKDFTTATIDLQIDVSSITTGDHKRDEHLKSADFFDVVHHKLIRFTSNNIKKTRTEGRYELRGALSIKGFSQEVVLDVQYGGIANDPWGNEKAGFTINGAINKVAWGLGWNQTMPSGSLMLSEEVLIACEIELTNLGQKDVTIEHEPIHHKTIV